MGFKDGPLGVGQNSSGQGDSPVVSSLESEIKTNGNPKCQQALVVRSRHLVDWIHVKAIWLGCPDFADIFIGGEAA